MAPSLIMLDRAQSPTLAQAKAALDEVGGSAWAYYVGGAGHFGDRTTYSTALLRKLHDAHIRTLPIYVGAQKGFSRARGLADGADAAARAKKFGDAHAPVMCDVERGPFNRAPVAALAYARAFCAAVHDAGMRAGAYGPFELMAQLADSPDPHDVPDVLWPARWLEDPGIIPPKTQWPNDPRKVKGIPATKLAQPGRRAWQFVGDVVLPRTNINVDISVIDAGCFDAQAPAKVTPKAAAKPVVVAKPATKPATKPAAKPQTLTIAAGDTLSALETRLKLPRGSLFAANAAVLDAAAREHGKPDCRKGGLIFPGTKIRLP